ncbi:hypothetical protein [Altererythrobacter sp. B11]|uniref:hypothetical protein n=1 Tax=Altererythrobacter sp. B11 TaxID=2060312 RepID=UPI0011AEB49A|nr:hypothetical protein [Altererythrobacter sp. B11]
MLTGAAGAFGATALASLPAVPAMGAGPSHPLRERLQADMEAYAAFGSKLSGSKGDRDSARWVGKRLSAAGFDVRLTEFDVPTFAPGVAELSVGEARLPVMPQPIVITTPRAGIEAALCLVRDPVEAPSVRDKIAVLILPYDRHAALFRGSAATFLKAVVPHAPAAIIIVTTGPTGKIIALNAKLEPAARVPIALLAPDDLPPVIKAAAAGRPARLTVTGTSSVGQSSNIVASRKAGSKWLAFSTPRSGWGICAGERGPGIAAFLEFCHWAAVRFPSHSLFAICTGGHELDFVGTHHALSEGPPATDTLLWTHLGAGLATRDAFEVLGRRNELLSSADPQRAMMCSPSLLQDVLRAFQGQAGYEQPIEVVGGAGELSSIIDRGYTNAFAGLGIHRWCHVADDTIDKVDGGLLLPVVEGHRAVIEAVVGRMA